MQLIELSETTLTKIATTLDPIVKKGKEYFSRVNHIFFEKVTIDMTFPNELINDLSLIPKFTLRFQAFSDIDDPYPFEVDFKQTSFTPRDIDTNNDKLLSDNNPVLDYHNQLDLNDNIMLLQRYVEKEKPHLGSPYRPCRSGQEETEVD